MAPSRMLVLQDQEWLSVWRSAHTHIVRLMNSRPKGPKRMMTKVQWSYCSKVIGKKEDLLPTNVTIDRGNLIRWVIRSWDKNHLHVDHLMHDNWVVCEVHSPEVHRRAETNPTCKFHKGYCASHWNSRPNKFFRSDILAQGNLMSVAPTLQNLRIGLMKRRNGKSKVPAKQRGRWPIMN